MTTTTLDSPPRALPLLATGVVVFMLAYATLMEGLHLGFSVGGQRLVMTCCALVAAVSVLAVALRDGRSRWPVWAMALLAVPVAVRLMRVGTSWDAGMLTSPVAGFAVGLYVYAAVRAMGSVEKAPVAGEWAVVVESAVRADGNLRRELAGRPLDGEVRKGLEARSNKLLASVKSMAVTWQRLESGASAELEQAVQTQLDGVVARRDSAIDALARREYERTAESLQRQLDSVRRIRRGAERALARARCQITVMETARLGVMAYAAQDASVQGEEAMRLSGMLDAAAEELELSAGAMEEANAQLTA
ncbi:MAG: hypothetical protein AB2A00_37130 [Myxococcota bacterium]